MKDEGKSSSEKLRRVAGYLFYRRDPPKTSSGSIFFAKMSKTRKLQISGPQKYIFRPPLRVGHVGCSLLNSRSTARAATMLIVNAILAEDRDWTSRPLFQSEDLHRFAQNCWRGILLRHASQMPRARAKACPLSQRC